MNFSHLSRGLLKVVLSCLLLVWPLLADDLVGVAETGSALQGVIDIVHNYSKCRHFEADVKKCAIVIFPKVGKVLSGWVWGGGRLLVLDPCFPRIEFDRDVSLDKHIKSLVIHSNKPKLGGLY